MMYILIASSETEYIVSKVYGASTIDEAKGWFENERLNQGIIVAIVNVDGYAVQIATVAYYNVSFAGHPGVKRWTEIRSS